VHAVCLTSDYYSSTLLSSLLCSLLRSLQKHQVVTELTVVWHQQCLLTHSLTYLPLRWLTRLHQLLRGRPVVLI